MKQNKILLIDDDHKLAEVLKAYLQRFNYSVSHYDHPQKGLDALKIEHPEVVILDIMMPDKDGLQVCREIRQESKVPIIFLSARGDTTDRIVGLEMGADDYMPKPFEPRELVARIESILRRSVPKKNERAQEQSQERAIEPLQLNENTMMASLNGQNLEFTATEFQALLYLYKHRDRIISRDELLTHLQGIDSEVYGRAIDILISRIRQKLGDTPKSGQLIKTIRSQGYRYTGGSGGSA